MQDWLHKWDAEGTLVQRYTGHANADPDTAFGQAREVLTSNTHAQRAARWWREWMSETTSKFGDPSQSGWQTERQDPEFDLELPAMLSRFPPRQHVVQEPSGLSEEDVSAFWLLL